MNGYTISRNEFGYWQVFYGQLLVASSKDLQELTKEYPDAYVNKEESYHE